MSKVTLVPDILTQFLNLRDSVDIYDDTGWHVGTFHPAPSREEMAEVRNQCPFSRDELEARRRERGGS